MANYDPELDPNAYQNYPGGSSDFNEGAYAGRIDNGITWKADTPDSGMKTAQDFQNALGNLYDPKTYESYVANVSNNGGGDPNDWFDRIVKKEQLRNTNEPNSTYEANGEGGYTVGPTGKVNNPFGGPLTPLKGISSAQSAGTKIPMPGTQFDDPYTKMLEQIAQSQLQQYQQPLNQQPYNQFQDFITKRFNELTQNPGYSPAEISLLNTQALEPIESLRQASKQRALQHAAQAGFLPTSGITELTQGQNGMPETLDTSYDRMRTMANRDLSINALNRRNQDLNSALQLGNLGIQIPQQQFADQQTRNNAALQIATLLQQLPAQAQAEALAVLNGTQSPGSLLNSVAAITQQSRQNNFSNWASIGQILAGLFQ